MTGRRQTNAQNVMKTWQANILLGGWSQLMVDKKIRHQNSENSGNSSWWLTIKLTTSFPPKKNVQKVKLPWWRYHLQKNYYCRVSICQILSKSMASSLHGFDYFLAWFESLSFFEISVFPVDGYHTHSWLKPEKNVQKFFPQLNLTYFLAWFDTSSNF